MGIAASSYYYAYKCLFVNRKPAIGMLAVQVMRKSRRTAAMRSPAFDADLTRVSREASVDQSPIARSNASSAARTV